jgi:hypothetical protein
MTTEVENTMTLTGNRALVTEQATQNESGPALACGRAVMAAVDSVASLSAGTMGRFTTRRSRRRFKLALGHPGRGTRQFLTSHTG